MIITNKELHKSLNKRIEELTRNNALLLEDDQPLNSLSSLLIAKQYLKTKDKEDIILDYTAKVKNIFELIEYLDLLDRIDSDSIYDLNKYHIDNMLKGYFDLSIEKGA